MPAARGEEERERWHATSRNEAGAATGSAYGRKTELLKLLNPTQELTTNPYAGEGQRRTVQFYGQPVYTQVWDGANYLGEVQ